MLGGYKVAGCLAYGFLALLSGCASTGDIVSAERRQLDVPEIDASVPPIPLRVAVYVEPAVLEARTYSKNSMTGQVVHWGRIGPQVLDAFAEYAPKAFARAALAPRFPDPAVARGDVDAVLAVEFAIGEWAYGSGFDDKLFNDIEVVVAVYTVDGTLIKRYSGYGSAPASRNLWNHAQTVQNVAAKSAIGVRPAVRAALLEFPTFEVLAHLARFQAEIRQRAEDPAPDAWQRRQAEFQAQVKMVQARTPANADDGVEFNKRMARIGNIGAGIGTAALGGMAAMGIGNVAASQATSLYMQHLMGDSEDFKRGLAAGQLATGLIALGGRGDAGGGAGGSAAGGNASYCQELLNMANQCRASQGSMRSLNPVTTRGRSGGGGQAGAFNDCYQNYMNAYEAACR